MADNNTSMAKRQDVGHKKELGDATESLATAMASGDPAAIRKATGDHATALNSQATAMAASIAAPVYTQLEALSSQMRTLAEIVTNARQHDLTWRTEERMRRDAQSTRLYDELDKLIAASGEAVRGLGKIDERVDAVVARLDHKRDAIANHELRITALEANNTRLEALEDAIAALRAASIVERDA